MLLTGITTVLRWITVRKIIIIRINIIRINLLVRVILQDRFRRGEPRVPREPLALERLSFLMIKDHTIRWELT